MPQTALIVGTGPGLSASFARKLHAAGYDLHLTARNTDKLADLAAQTNATLHQLDGTDAAALSDLVVNLPGDLRVACYNPLCPPARSNRRT